VYFANLRHVIRCKTCVSGLNTLFLETKVVKHSFSSIGHKMMFGVVSKHFSNLRQVKRCKNLCFGHDCTILVYQSSEASVLVHLTQNDVLECFRAFH
jgi:hypothetical protein